MCSSDLSASGAFFAIDQLEKSGFPCTAGPGEKDEFPVADRDIDILQGRPCFQIGLIKMAHADHILIIPKKYGSSIGNRGFTFFLFLFIIKEGEERRRYDISHFSRGKREKALPLKP